VCRFCERKGHWQRECELFKKTESIINKKKDGKVVGAVTSEDYTFHTREVVATANHKVLDPFDILCDNQSTVNIFIMVNF
jgi:hypothetical protein